MALAEARGGRGESLRWPTRAVHEDQKEEVDPFSEEVRGVAREVEELRCIQMLLVKWPP